MNEKESTEKAATGERKGETQNSRVSKSSGSPGAQIDDIGIAFLLTQSSNDAESDSFVGARDHEHFSRLSFSSFGHFRASFFFQ